MYDLLRLEQNVEYSAYDRDIQSKWQALNRVFDRDGNMFLSVFCQELPGELGYAMNGVSRDGTVENFLLLPVDSVNM